MPKTNRATISTHVLDTTRGEPAAGVTVTLWRIDGRQPLQQASRETDADGRIADLAAGSIEAGTYSLVFDVAAYFATQRRGAPFLQRVSVEFRINSADPHCHVPLLLTPYACTSYRGT
jgi:5-hydroxyisourate hydrolase